MASSNQEVYVLLVAFNADDITHLMLVEAKSKPAGPTSKHSQRLNRYGEALALSALVFTYWLRFR